MGYYQSLGSQNMAAMASPSRTEPAMQGTAFHFILNLLDEDSTLYQYTTRQYSLRGWSTCQIVFAVILLVFNIALTFVKENDNVQEFKADPLNISVAECAIFLMSTLMTGWAVNKMSYKRLQLSLAFNFMTTIICLYLTNVAVEYSRHCQYLKIYYQCHYDSSQSAIPAFILTTTVTALSVIQLLPTFVILYKCVKSFYQTEYKFMEMEIDEGT